MAVHPRGVHCGADHVVALLFRLRLRKRTVEWARLQAEPGAASALIIIPILLIDRRYDGTTAMLLIAGGFSLATAAGYVVELLFAPLGLIPQQREAQVLEATISWNDTTWLNVAFLAALLLVRFVRSGSGPVLRTTGGAPDGDHGTPRTAGSSDPSMEMEMEMEEHPSSSSGHPRPHRRVSRTVLAS